MELPTRTQTVLSGGITVEQAMKRLHVQKNDGEFVTGAYAFQTLWQQLPYYRWLAKLVSPSWILASLDVIYRQFAKRRFARRRRCDSNCSL